jgi:hypothetical protein
MTDELTVFSRAAFAATVCVSALGFAGSAAAAGPESLREGLFGQRPAEGRQFAAPPIARYVSEDGDIFILDRTQPRPLLKFENSNEVWVLAPQPGPRGDMIYKNDLGQPMLRATRLGGVTVFTDQRPEGSAAALAGGGNPLRMSVLGPQALLDRMIQASARASRAARRLIAFEAPSVTPASSSLVGDAAMIASEAVVRISRRPDGPKVLAKFNIIRFAEGRKPAAQVSRGTLQITVTPAQGVSGRPSSDRIVAVARSAR